MKDSWEEKEIRAKASLLDWFHKCKRDLPFRVKPTAYKIWVSEVMLQQTRVAAMLPIYNQFLLRFPNMEALATAEEEEVLEFWSGLGYYSRARNLKKACSYVLSTYNGKFPESLEEAMEIPGVGPYTARAVLSMAYGKTYAVLDGNVKRVVSRLFAEKDEKKWQVLADRFLNSNHPGDHNQAMMELGAMICLPNPRCKDCPVSDICRANQLGVVEKYPPPKKEREKLDIQLHFYLIHREGKFLLIKDKNRRFFKDIYSLPFQILPDKNTTSLPLSYHTPQYILDIIESLGTEPVAGTTNHSITHHRIKIYLHKTIQPLPVKHHIIQGAGESWTDWERLDRDFPSSIAKKILKFPGVGGLFAT